ncbi:MULTISPECIES: SusC/RagA family TonB-linked outer membrane protein [unclassified Parabacteroides]|uniref:SusC/RagA family TonB-linked outer membrane protein n=1 Tax=unclassified Parabacteroides TaxID=2649774 RepID=UPI002473D211|nr:MULTISPECIES: SusC/RagA family TonB-linked outer membrane protein [unclassified Parabacteroides]
MRNAMICMFLGIVSVTASVHAQKNSLSIDVRNGTIYDVVSEIEKQTDYMFFYKNGDINNEQKVSVYANNKLVSEVLDIVVGQTDLGYIIDNRHILLTKKTSNALQQVTISGVVKDEAGEPLYGVNVLLKGTSTGVVTDIDGKYILSVPGENAVLVFSYIGYDNQEVVVGNRRTINITMRESSLMIDELVVTALGMKRSEKALGYATQQIGGDQFEKVKGANLATSLTGRISGLTVFNSTEFMESPQLKLRGENPILILDGVPTALTLGDLNSDDILSIDVLKGATASALYGSRGGSGAIMVTTKKGGKQGFSVTVNTSNMFNAGTLALPKVQSSYSAGYNGKYNTDDEVWGDKLDIGRVYSQWDPIAKEMRDMELTSRGKNNFDNFREFSMISNTTVSVSQQGENGSFRSSLSYVYNKGQYPNSKGQQFRYTLGGEMKLTDKLSIEGTMGYSKQIAPNTSGTGYGDQGYIYNLLIWTGPEYDVRDYRDYWITPDVEQNWHYAGWYDNPYLMAYEKRNTIDYNKLNSMFSVNYQIFSWMKALARVGMDLYANQTQRRAPIGVNSTRDWGGTNKGYYQERNDYSYTINSDFILMAEKRFGQFTIDGMLGGSIYLSRLNEQWVQTRNGLSIPGFYSLKASVESPEVYRTKLERKQVNSLFGKLSLGYMNAFYVDITGRNDWSSTLPTDDNSYFYPSVGGSVIMSELIGLPEWMNFWKLRGSWTLSKSDLAIYDINQAYQVKNSVWNGMNSALYPKYQRGNVKPITNRTYEVGTSLHFLNNRLKLDVSYYNKLTYNNTTRVKISPLSGYEELLINTDEEIVRRGVELFVDAVPMQTKDFTWNTVFNWSSSRRYYAQLDEQYSPDKPWVSKGARYDAFEARQFDYDPNGNLILYNGYPKLSDYQSRIGYKDPDWVWGWTNSFKYKQFVLTVGFDGRVGGMSNSETNRRMWQTGAHPDSDTQWRYEEVVNGNKTYMGNGVKIVSGSVTYDSYGNILSDNRVFAPNDQVVSYETYIKDYWRTGPQLNLSETFFKLRELSLSYDVPKTIAGKLGMNSASVALVGQNLLLWTKKYKYADPDKGGATPTTKDSDGRHEDLASPSIRYMGINIKVEF